MKNSFSSLLKKPLAVVLSTAMLCATAAFGEAVGYIGENIGCITVSALDETPAEDFTFIDNSTGITITGYTGNDENVVIPATINGKPVTIIGNYAFMDNTTVVGVTIQEGVTSIYGSAFYGCSEMTHINLPTTLRSISNYAFENCSRLVGLSLPYGLTEIGMDAFRCSGLKVITIPGTVKRLTRYSFEYNDNLTSVTFGEGMEYIGSQAFLCCPQLTRAVIPESVTEIASNVFQNCPEVMIYGKTGSYAESYAKSAGIPFEDLNAGDFEYHEDQYGNLSVSGYNGENSDIVIPASYNGKKVTAIDFDAFKENNTIKSVVIANGIKSIGSDAFYKCGELELVTIPASVETIGTYSFYSCPKLRTVNLSEGLKTIGQSAFSKCTSLETIDIPENTSEIGVDAFFGCTSLIEVSISEGPTYISGCTFMNCIALTTVSLPDSLLYINSRAFESCTALRNLNLPQNLKSISQGAFKYCKSLGSVLIPTKMTKIDSNAFAYCDLTYAVIPERVTSISSDSFSFCSKLIIFGSSGSYAESYANSKGIPFVDTAEFNYTENSNETLTLTGYTGEDGDLVIPPGINGKRITAIDDEAFSYYESLTSVIIPEGVLTIADNSFIGCCYMKSVSLPSTLTALGSGAFQDCSELTEIAVPADLTEIPEKAFYGCKGLKSITLCEGLEIIGKEAFCKCASLSAVALPDSLETIEDYAFEYCSSLKEVNIPSGVKSLGDYCFCCCSSLYEVNLSYGLEIIGRDAFDNCISLVMISIPETVTSIDHYCFYECYALEIITIPESVVSIGTDCFYNCDKLTIYGKKGSAAEAYANENEIPFVSVAGKLENNSAVNAEVLTVGSRIYMTGAAEGGKAPYKYNYSYKRTTSSKWNTLGAEWGTSETERFTVKSTGTFNIRISVKDADGTVEDKTFTVRIVDGKSKAFENNSTVSTSGAKPGTKIILTGAASGSEGFRYAYYYKRTTAVAWTILGTEFGTTTTKSFTPKSEGEFNLKIDIVDKNGELVSKQFAMTISDAYTNTGVVNGSTINTTSALPGTKIILTGASSGGYGNCTYAYYYKKAQATNWTVIGTEFGTATTAAVTLRNVGDYIFRTTVKDADGIVSKNFSVEITDTQKEELKNDSIISETSISAGTVVTAIGSASGGAGEYTYTYQYKKSSAKLWNNMTFTSNGATFKPKTAGSYDVKVTVVDKDGVSKDKTFVITVT